MSGVEDQSEEGPGMEDTDVPERPVTGDPAVDAALGRLATDLTSDVGAHVMGFEAVHRVLQDRLADTEE